MVALGFKQYLSLCALYSGVVDDLRCRVHVGNKSWRRKPNLLAPVTKHVSGDMVDGIGGRACCLLFEGVGHGEGLIFFSHE